METVFNHGLITVEHNDTVAGGHRNNKNDV